MRCMACGADYAIERLSVLMSDLLEEALSDIRCDRF
jgi:hypothetical protein